VVNPLILLVVLAMGVLTLILPRNKITAPFLAVLILIPMDQVLVIGGLHFPMLRFLALFGFVKLVREKSAGTRVFSGGINRIDLAVISFAIVTGFAGVLLFQNSGALIYQLGNVYTIFGLYFLMRYLVRDKADLICMLRSLAVVAMLVAIAMGWEVSTGRNPYALLGGALATKYTGTTVRAGRFRASGCFEHSILAGTFGAILIPLFVALWQSGPKNHRLAIVGIISATVITITSNSSTPILAYAAGVLALCLWPVRNWMQAMRWAVVITIVSLHLVMKAPVWNLIARIDVSGQASSYHRFMLIDQCIRHFSDWWLIGVKTTYEWGWDMWDTANQYVSICDKSGLLSFILFLAIIVYGFKYIGKARRAAPTLAQQKFLWALGAALFANVVAFVGISYTDQTQVVWYGLLAAISAAAVAHTKSKSDSIVRRVQCEMPNPITERVPLGYL